VRCWPSGIPEKLNIPDGLKLVQTPDVTIFLHESRTIYRQVFTDGRPLPKDAQPMWMGYSIGRWEGETFVVETVKQNGRTWLDMRGLPGTEALKVTERYTRPTVGRIYIDVTIDDPMAYTKPWSVRLSWTCSPTRISSRASVRRTTATCLTWSASSMRWAATAGLLSAAVCLGACGAPGAPVHRLSIATGGTGGVFYPYGGGIAKVLSTSLPGIEVTAEVTAASVDNLKFLKQGDSDIAFTMADMAKDGLGGQDAFKDFGAVPVRALAVLYPSYTHLVVRGDSAITSVAGLKGKVVSTGPPGAGPRSWRTASWPPPAWIPRAISVRTT
jgi:hypothetical protein